MTRTVLAVLAAVLVAAPAAWAAEPAGEALFVQSADSGTLRGGKLTLRGVSGYVAWFADRPVRDSGIIRFRTYRRALFTRGPAPNAALEIAGRGVRGVVPLELRRPRYNARRNTVTYRVKRLRQVGGDKLQHLRNRVHRKRVPRRFGEASLFIDGAFGHTCSTTVVNDTGYSIRPVSSSKWSTDTWNPAPPDSNFGLGPGASWNWRSDGGDFRGCGNTMTWTIYNGPSANFSFETVDPWTGDNTITCTSSNPDFYCIQTAIDDADVTWTLARTP